MSYQYRNSDMQMFDLGFGKIRCMPHNGQLVYSAFDVCKLLKYSELGYSSYNQVVQELDSIPIDIGGGNVLIFLSAEDVRYLIRKAEIVKRQKMLGKNTEQNVSAQQAVM